MRPLESSSCWFLWSRAQSLCSVCRESQSPRRDSSSRAGLGWPCTGDCGGSCPIQAEWAGQAPWPRSVVRGWQGAALQCRTSALALPGSQPGSCHGSKPGELPLTRKGLGITRSQPEITEAPCGNPTKADSGAGSTQGCAALLCRCPSASPLPLGESCLGTSHR